MDFASEGPLGKNSKASYLVNYRYSFLEIAKKLHAINMENETLDYQDLSFKINMPTTAAGTFAVWFTGLVDNYENKVPDVSDWETLWDMNDSWSRQRSCAGGLTHSYRFRSGGTLRSNISFTGSYTRLKQNDYDEQMTKIPDMDGRNANLNDQWLIEPRISVQYKTSPSSTLSLAYALNSRRETTDTYFVTGSANKDLGLTRSHHISASFAQRLGDNAMLKIEPYWQWLFDVPVEQGTTYSILNHNMFFQDRTLVNDGAGRNYGIDLTLERYLKDGLYGMLTATLFKSEYRDAQGQWRHSRHDRGYIANILGGKE